MASSAWETLQFSSEEYVESCGAIVFDFSESVAEVCLVHYTAKDEWMLAKGRRNCGESRHDAAIREMTEETGYNCRLFPATMKTRAPAVIEPADVPDCPRAYANIVEPFMVTARFINGSLKTIFWYIAEVQGRDSPGKGEEGFTAQFFSTECALQKLTFQNDREVLQKAVEIVQNQGDGE